MSNIDEPMPKKVTAIGILMVISGILMIFGVIGSVLALLIVGTVFLVTVIFSWIGLIMYLVLIPYILILAGGIVELVFGIRILMGKVPGSLPVWSPVIEILFGIYMITTVIGIFILAIGITNLILMLQDDSRMYFYKRADMD